MTSVTSILAATGLCVPMALLAQADSSVVKPSGPLGPPIRQIATASAVSTEPFRMIATVRELPGGRVLVNDPDARRLVVLDSMMVVSKVVLDTGMMPAQPYGRHGGTLLPYRGDSSLFFAQSEILLVIDPQGNVARVRSYPRRRFDVQDWGAMGESSYGLPGVDAQGRLIHSVRTWFDWSPTPPRGRAYTSENPDSMLVVGMHLDTWTLDTIAKVKATEAYAQVHKRRNGSFKYTPVFVPIRRGDQFAVLSDGALALVRSLDYHIDYINTDGTRSSSAKLPYAWEPLNDTDKKRLVDSLRTAIDVLASQWYTTAMIRWINQYGKRRLPEGFPFQHSGIRSLEFT